ncbi:uncharacterized protein LY89DRAFT_714205 [Mollisia scopiformis]|uniref:RING-type domain-containing protein n=1 Tax=Mollisia scopiformis TaxID=149040 RepID=A0A194XRN6_MOLSC|nr:uncharacterized protein LY89DRAFT_714205 [Mollisia scopiformis]KUJ22392.1 hypothetical protein LY89DRAFT_714205 [Mollisia scopiformis]
MSSRPRFDAAAQNSNPTYKASLTPPSSKSSMKEKKQVSVRDRDSGSRETTPTAKSGVMIKSDTQLATAFRSDLMNIKSTVTCSICDQLLYEPYTLACGHTYCYSCLCNWFVPNKHKKTCPECRARVKQIPTPNYIVKSIVDVFTKQIELMPADENPEQHVQRRAEEIAEVEKDRHNPAGLFKGTFSRGPRRKRLFRDEEDGGVLRCPGCGHEHEGGPACAICGEEIDEYPYDFSDFDEDDADLEIEDIDNLELDLDADEINAEFADMHGHHHFIDLPNFGPAAPHLGNMYGHRFLHPAVLEEVSDLSNSEGSENIDSEEDDNSLDGFVVQDDDDEEPIRVPNNRRGRPTATQHFTIDLTSDDESDEGGAISNGRLRRRRGSQRSTPPPAVPNALSISDGSAHESDFDETLSEAEQRLQNAGWSPLDNGHDSEIEIRMPYDHDYPAYGTSEDDEHGDGASDTTNTSTIGGNVNYHERERREEDDLSDSSHSETPTYHGGNYPRDTSPFYRGNYAGQYQYLGEEEEDDEVTNGYSTNTSGVMDRDGDTEMSASSRSRSSSSVTPNPYATAYDEVFYAREGSEPVTEYGDDYGDAHESEPEYHPREARDVSEQRTDYGEDRQLDSESDYGYMTPAHTYVANAVHEPEPEAESSDSSIRPPNRRQPRQPRQYLAPSREGVQVHNYHYNPFVPLATESRQRMERGSRANPICFDDAGDDWEGDVRSIIEPSSRTRRMTAYRDMPTRRIDPLRSSRSPSASRVMSSSYRNSRYAPQYSRRG